MKIMCAGGGPAGLYFAISAKLRDPRHEIEIVERNPAGETYGWGVTFSDSLLDSLYCNDPVSAQRMFDKRASWHDQEVHVRRERAHLGGYGYAIGRQQLLDILVDRALQLDVEIQFEREIDDLSKVADADLVVACDGVNSHIRRLRHDRFRTDSVVGRNKYLWLGTDRMFRSFLFAFEETPAGWVWFYSYPYWADATTVIVECSPDTWRGLGLDELGPEETLTMLEQIFARHLDGHALVFPTHDLRRVPWLNFTRITNGKWSHGNVVLLGDAAHTTHFSIGSGTTLAMKDAIELADSIDKDDELHAALASYEQKRRADIVEAQMAALNSAEWFENVPSYIDQPITQFAYSLWKRRGHHPWWRYQLHLATQFSALRGVRRTVSAVRNERRARRRCNGLSSDSAASFRVVRTTEGPTSGR